MCHLLYIPEQYPPPTAAEVPLNTNGDPLPEPQANVDQPQTEQVQEPPVVVTRSGRISRPNSLFKDYTT